MNKCDEIVKILKDKCETISFMESCTGGLLASTFTNTEGSSLVFSFGAVTYSNDYKIQFGVRKDVIDTYSVYSMETAKEMARAISTYTSSTYGIGITGKLGTPDPLNPFGENNIVYISIYDSKKDTFLEQTMTMEVLSRAKEKEKIVTLTFFLLLQYLKENK